MEQRLCLHDLLHQLVSLKARLSVYGLRKLGNRALLWIIVNENATKVTLIIIEFKLTIPDDSGRLV